METPNFLVEKNLDPKGTKGYRPHNGAKVSPLTLKRFLKRKKAAMLP